MVASTIAMVSFESINVSGILRTFFLLLNLSSDWTSASKAGSNLGAKENWSNSPITIEWSGIERGTGRLKSFMISVTFTTFS